MLTLGNTSNSFRHAGRSLEEARKFFFAPSSPEFSFLKTTLLMLIYYGMNKNGIILAFIPVISGAGCAKSPLRTADKIEKAAREEITVVEKAYRPEGEKPVLPVLDENSGIGDFIEYTLLNNPKAESFFYRCKSAVERTTAAKYLPDHEINFEASISGIVQSKKDTLR